MKRQTGAEPSPDPGHSCLHLVAGAGQDALNDCLAQARPEDAIVFLDAGVLHLIGAGADSPGGFAGGIGFAAADLEAHGLAETARRSKVDILDDDAICRLLALYRHCLTWT